MTDIQVLENICHAELEASSLFIQARNVPTEWKTGRRDIVTSFDRQVQELLIQRIAASCPDARFFCEENDRQDDLSAEHVFIIDPIDGTMNFVHGFHHSCISVAYMRKGRLCAASIYNPYTEEFFTAARGEGSRLNSVPIHVSPLPLSESIVCCGTAPYTTALADRSFTLMKKAYLSGLDIRREGSAALDLCSAAAGRAGLYFELGLSLWDYAAGLLIVEEAGGICCTIDGRPIPLDGSRPSVVAGGKQAVAEFLSLAQER